MSNLSVWFDLEIESMAQMSDRAPAVYIRPLFDPGHL